MAEQIRTKIPTLYKEAIKWKLLYSIDQHGLSLKTLYSNIKHAGPCVMAITTENDEVFGAFTSEPFDPTVSKNYYGSGLSFIWKLNEQGNIDFYQAINSNQYYMLADKHFIAMGGGNGKFGFYLNENLIDGYISPCMTYNYDRDITESENFECYGLEIWGFEF
ncbi:TLD-domain-containing protein [Anaeromyces robustus]|uniref:Oxidation resistance protein 1 n=1 Tax=Anaeromyces robustus TaxID=1754192 RepID=A0A1Y1XKJ0_9FUNG|nr:TLD-domain-containing protein [Anaeromyces robustus]|eukprot:ORX86268.1 TLD-domain-containing protein [Anaeromyces robustus]